MDECEVEKRNVQWFSYEDPRSKRPDEHKLTFHPRARLQRDKTVIRLPSFEKVSKDKALYAHANRVLHLETNPGNARALVQKHGNSGRVDQPAADPADHAGNGLRVRAALRPLAAPVLQGRTHPRL